MNHFEIGHELLNGETIYWQGQPDPKIVFTANDVFLVPFSILWGGFAIFWEASVLGIGIINKQAPNEVVFPFALFGIPFVLIGLYFIFGRFIYKKAQKEKTYYFVTNLRLLIATTTSLKSVDIKGITNVSKKIRKDGSGSIQFGEGGIHQIYANTGMDFLVRSQLAPAFYDINRAEEVYRLILDLKNGKQF